MGCVVWSKDSEQAEVFVGGTLIGTFDRRDRGARNVILVGLASDPKARLGKLATAFGVNAETLRRIRLQHEEEGLSAVVSRAPGGSEKKLQGAALRRAEQLFARSASLATVRAALAKLHVTVSRATLSGARAQWRARMAGGPTTAPPASEEPGATAPTQQELWPNDADTATESKTRRNESAASAPAKDAAATEPAAEEHAGARHPLTGAVPRSGRFVQHLGSWLLLGSLAAMGVYTVMERERCRAERNGRRLRAATVRVALDALVVALAVGQRCIEGVRRLQTVTAGTLLRASGAPTATWVRRALGLLAGQTGAAYISLGLAGVHLRTARAGTDTGPVVFYLDNHLRPYTGQEVIRKGWRMQDRRVRPGITDCYVHDEDGRAVFRLDSPAHESLTALVPRVTRLLRVALGDEERILVAFDRGGAYPQHLANLRATGFEFVTYERRPYAELPANKFVEQLVMPDGEVLTWCEPQMKNLGRGRGRVRRIAVRDGEGRQLNLVAISHESAPRLIAVMYGRWNQENAFKHAVERWGQNQLDARTVAPYSPDTVIPNPARRRLDHTLRLARVREGDARRLLARLAAEAPQRAGLEADLAAAIRTQEELEAQRPHVPKRQELAQTDLADKLVYHVPDFKLLVDGVRVACANAEADLAALLAPHLRRPREAKKLLGAVFAAPGHVVVNTRTITVSLLCPGNRGERRSIAAFLEAATAARFQLPGDPRRRRLVFRSLESGD
jgi:transposase-like protein